MKGLLGKSLVNYGAVSYLLCQPLPKITKKNGCHGYAIKDRDFKKLSTTNFVSVFNINMLSAISYDSD